MNSKEAIRALAALAQEHRLAVFRLLVREGPEGMNAGAIAQCVGISATALSFHLKELENAGLVTARRDGRYIHYALAGEGMRVLLDFLMQDCCQGRSEICMPQVERPSAPVEAHRGGY